MMRWRTRRAIGNLLLTGCMVLLAATGTFAADMESVPEVPVPGKATMVDLGAKNCVPCQMMVPILDELKKEYIGRVAIVVIDVMEHPGLGQKLGIMSIPTQIFYDADGNETMRHVGFMEKADIIAEFEKLGIK